MQLVVLVTVVAAALQPAAADQWCVDDPCYAPKEFDCPMRKLALEYANVTLGPASNLHSVFEALNISGGCGSGTAPPPSKPKGGGYGHGGSSSVSGEDIFVAVNGSDKHGDGSIGTCEDEDCIAVACALR